MLSPQDRAKLRAESSCDDITIQRWARGERVQPATDARLRKAAQALGIPVPEAVAQHVEARRA